MPLIDSTAYVLTNTKLEIRFIFFDVFIYLLLTHLLTINILLYKISTTAVLDQYYKYPVHLIVKLAPN